MKGLLILFVPENGDFSNSYMMKLKIAAVLITALYIASVDVSALEKEVYFTSANESVEVVKGVVHVKFKSGVSATLKKSIAKSYGAVEMKSINRLGIEKIRIPDNRTVNEMVGEFSGREDVQYAEPVYIRRASKLPTEYADESSLNQRQWGLYKINAHDAWDTETGSGITIAVLDTGIDLDHPDLAANLWQNSSPETAYTGDYTIVHDTHGWDFVNDDNNPDDDDTFSGGHGTHCAGIITARANTSTYTVVGVSWTNKLMAVKILDYSGYGTSSDLIDAITYAADKGADIISLSLGGVGVSEAEREAVNYAYNKGVVIVAATGNTYSALVDYPAAYDHVIAVGATNANDERAAFSNYGENIDVVAPGAEIYSTVIGGYKSMDGTSMACPHVSGLAALVMSYWNNVGNTGWTPQQVSNVITSNCDDVNSAAYSGWDKYSGYGRINAESTLDFISSGVSNIDNEKVLVYPNPFSPVSQKAMIVLPSNSGGTVKKLKIYSLDGQLVRENGGSGRVIYWDGKNDDGDMCATGLYFYYLDTTSGSQKGKITLIK